MSTATALLEALPRHFDSVAPTLPAAQRALSFASNLLRLAEEQRWSGVRSSNAALKQQLLAAARVLSDFAAAAACKAATGAFPAALLAHSMAGVKAVASCALLACTIKDLDAQAAFAICAPCSLVFGTGSTFLAPVVQGQPRQIAFELCAAQLGAAGAAVADLLRSSQQPRAAAAFANSTAKPLVLVTWLGELCKALLCLQDGIEPDGRRAVSTSLVVLLHKLLTAEPYARHRDVLAARPDLQQAVADAVLAHGLGGLPAALGPDCSQIGVAVDTLVCLPVVLRHPTLAAAVVQRLHTTGAVAVMRHVAALIETLPVRRPASMPASTFMHAHSNALLLLNLCCQRQVGSLHADGSIMLDVDIWTRGGTGGTEGSSSSVHLQQAAWQLVALVPRVLATLRALADDPDGPAAFPADRWLGLLEGACTNVASALFLLLALERQPASAEQLTSWVAAATAGLRLQPLLLQLDSQFQQMQRAAGDASPAAEGAWRLSGILMVRLWRNMPAFDWQALHEPAGAEGLAASLAELHSTACRLAHFTVSRGSPALAGTQLEATLIVCWTEQLAMLTTVFKCLMSARLRCYVATGNASFADPKGDEGTYDLQGACAAHLHAVLAVAGAAAGEAGAAENAQWPGVLRRGLAVAVQYCSRYIDRAWDLAVDAAFDSLAGHAVQVSSPLELASELLWPVAEAATNRPRLTMALARGSLLGRMLLTAGQLATSAEDNATVVASMLLGHWEAALLELANDVPQPGVSAAQYGVADSVLTEAQAAAGALLKQHQQLLYGPGGSVLERAEQLQQLVQPAAQLGVAMVDLAHSPAVEKFRQLELAKAAATRSCAYLRCANVAGQGGPAAGQGVGSLRCSACRAVWYCGTACSHADWRAGHKRVCRALAAERQAAKAARTAAAAEAAAAAGQEGDENGV